MKHIIPVLLMVTATSSAFALDSDKTGKQETTATQSTAQSAQKDREILGFLIVLNTNEIAAAKTVAGKSVDKDVSDYATLMIEQHTQNLKDTLTISQETKMEPLDTAEVVTLKAKGKNELTVLMPLNNVAFEKAYIDAMVKGHTDALAAIDMQLKEVTNPELKKHLTATRAHVIHHLEKAQEIQKTLQAKS